MKEELNPSENGNIEKEADIAQPKEENKKAEEDDQINSKVADVEQVDGDPYGFYRRVGSPKYFVAPMVD